MTTTTQTRTYRSEGFIEGEELHIEAIQASTGASREQAVTLIDAAEPLFDALGHLGWTDGYGGGETRRVMPEALWFIRHRSNCAAVDGACPFCDAFVMVAPELPA